MDLTQLRKLLCEIEYKDWTFNLSAEGSRLSINIPTPEQVTWHSRTWLLSVHMTPSEVVQTVFLAIQVAEEHELREQFKYRGHQIFGPHYNVDALVNLCHNGGQQPRPDNRKE